MQTLIPGEIKSSGSTKPSDGFIMLRGLLVMFIVIICFAAVIASMTVLSRQGSRLLENVQQEINTRNKIALERMQQ
ncbi:MAG: hypothetical protein FWD36_02695 [Treponema sp.]|nr:hypothetical protein [Treponema sp.]